MEFPGHFSCDCEQVKTPNFEQNLISSIQFDVVKINVSDTMSEEIPSLKFS